MAMAMVSCHAGHSTKKDRPAHNLTMGKAAAKMLEKKRG